MDRIGKYTSLAILAGGLVISGCRTAEPVKPEPYFKKDEELEKLKEGHLYERVMYLYLFGSDDTPSSVNTR